MKTATSPSEAALGFFPCLSGRADANIPRADWKVVSDGKIRKIDEELHGLHYTSINFFISPNKILLDGYTIDVTDGRRSEEALRKVIPEAEADNRVNRNVWPIGAMKSAHP